MITRLATRGPRFFVGVSALSVFVAASVTGILVARDDGAPEGILGGTIDRSGRLAPSEDAGSAFGSTRTVDGEPSPGDLAVGAGRLAEVLGDTLARADRSAPTEAVDGGFGITGLADGELSPGVERRINLRFTNPNSFAIVVDSVKVAVSDQNAACAAAENLQVTRQFSGTVTVPANGAVTVPAPSVQRPSVTMINLGSNQDPCKGATFTFTYTGTASRA